MRGCWYRGVRPRRLGFERVESDAPEFAGLESRQSGVLVLDESSAAGVDEDRSVLHQIDCAGVDHVVGALEERHVQSDDVRCARRISSTVSTLLASGTSATGS